MAEIKEIAPYAMGIAALVTLITVLLKWWRFKPKDRAEVGILNVEREIKLSEAWIKYSDNANNRISELEKQVVLLNERLEKSEERLKEERRRCDKETADLWDHYEKLIEIMHAQARQQNKRDSKNDSKTTDY